jgi:hypothetical protein
MSRFSGIIPAQKQQYNAAPRGSLLLRVSKSYSVLSGRAISSSPANIEAVFEKSIAHPLTGLSANLLQRLIAGWQGVSGLQRPGATSSAASMPRASSADRAGASSLIALSDENIAPNTIAAVSIAH